MYYLTVTTSYVVLLYILFSSRTINSSFILEPTDKSIVKGETVVLKCSVTNDVERVYWYYSLGRIDGWISNNNVIQSSLPQSKRNRYSIIGDTTNKEYFLQIRNVSAEDAADYKCFFYPSKPTGPNKTPVASLVVLDPPKTPLCTLVWQNTAIPNQAATMRCTSTGTPIPRIVWQKNGIPIEDNIPRSSLNNMAWNITENERGSTFSCVVAYPKVRKPPSCSLTPVPIKPKVSVDPGVQPMMLNKTGKFVCEGNDIDGPLKYKWWINGKVPSLLLTEDVHFRIKHNGKTLKILWATQVLNKAQIVCRVTGKKDPKNPDDNNIHYGQTTAFVSEPEIVPTNINIAVTVGSGNNETGGEYVNGGDDKSEFGNDAEARGEIGENDSSTGTVIGIVLSMFVLLALVIVLAIFLYKRNNQINQSGKRISAHFMQFVSTKSNSNDESAVNTSKHTNEQNVLYAKPIKKKKDSRQLKNDDADDSLSQPAVLPRLVSKKKEKEITDGTSCAVEESTDVDTPEEGNGQTSKTTEHIAINSGYIDVDLSDEPNVDCEADTNKEDDIIAIDIVYKEEESTDNKSETSKTGSLLRSIYAKLPTEKFSSFISDLRPKKPTRTFAESMLRLRTHIVPKRKNKPDKEEDSVEEEEYIAVNVDDVPTQSENIDIENDTQEKKIDEVTKSKAEVVKVEEDVEKSKVEVQQVEVDNTEVAQEESDDIPSLPSEQDTFDKPVMRRNRKTAVDSLKSASAKSDTSSRRSSHTLDNILANVKRRSLSRRISGFDGRGSTPDLRVSRRIDKNDIVHFVPLGNKGNDMTGNVEVVKNRQSINFENEMSQTLLKSFHEVVPNRPQAVHQRVIEDFPSYENLDEKESCVSESSAYMTDDFSDDEFDTEESKPTERVAPMRIIDDIPVYENTDLKPLNDSKEDSSGNAVKFGGKGSTKQSKPTMRVKPTPTPRSFRKNNGSNSSRESKTEDSYEELPKKSTAEDVAKDIDPTTGESIYDNVDYQL
ncbi:uncharacterized protein [Antedon mediterranea]|uniref:uncharacterized protein n=1 Tax=Antedon mediterranea TaxID=105859 RepID=UPI003AF5D209